MITTIANHIVYEQKKNKTIRQRVLRVLMIIHGKGILKFAVPIFHYCVQNAKLTMSTQQLVEKNIKLLSLSREVVILLLHKLSITTCYIHPLVNRIVNAAIV